MTLFWVLVLQCIAAVFAQANIPTTHGTVTTQAPVVSTSPPNIVGGHPINITDAPYQAVLRPMFCGGSIISRFSILTAAQCFNEKPDVKKVSVGVGSADKLTLAYYPIYSYVVHPSYNEKTNDFDVAIITLMKPLTLTVKVKAVILETVPQAMKFFPPIVQTRVTGWGESKNDDSSKSQILMAAEGTIDWWAACKVDYFFKFKRVTERMICSSHHTGGEAFCRGDTGGALIDAKTNKQIGIASWGGECRNGTRYQVYTNVIHKSIGAFIVEYMKK